MSSMRPFSIPFFEPILLWYSNVKLFPADEHMIDSIWDPIKYYFTDMVRKGGTHPPIPYFLPRKELLIGVVQTVRKYDKYDHGKNSSKKGYKWCFWIWPIFEKVSKL